MTTAKRDESAAAPGVEAICTGDDAARFCGTLRDGVLSGPARITCRGAPLADLGFADGVLSGSLVLWGAQHRPTARLNYRHGQLHGPACFYDLDGTLLREANYRDGVLHGRVRTYFPDGKISEDALYHAGQLHGELLRFHANHRLASRQNYINGVVDPATPAELFDAGGHPLDASGKRHPFWKRWLDGLARTD